MSEREPSPISFTHGILADDNLGGELLVSNYDTDDFHTIRVTFKNADNGKCTIDISRDEAINFFESVLHSLKRASYS